MDAITAAKLLNIEQVDYVYRLCRSGALSGRKVNGRWVIDPASVDKRKRRVAVKRSSKSNAAAERDRRREAARAAFA